MLKTKNELYSAGMDYLRRQARNDLLCFILYTKRDYLPNWHHRNICDKLQQFAEGSIRNLIITVPPQHGKALEYDTPVLTTNGWKAHGSLEYGDYVYGRNGEPVKVLQNHGVNIVYGSKVDFAGGESIMASDNHEWSVLCDREQYRNKCYSNIVRHEELLETQQLMKGQRRNPAIQADIIINGSGNPYPDFDAYKLGSWLGDGTSINSYITVGDEDLEHFSGYFPTEVSSGPNKSAHTLRDDTLYMALKKHGLFNNKHIPEEYFTASVDVRLALLQGLMDTDGYCDKKGRCEFTQKKGKLSEDIFILLRTLGIKPTFKSYNMCLYHRIIGRKDRIFFSPPAGMQVFRLKRKQAILDKKTNHRQDAARWFIESVEKIGLILANCITVEGGYYLAGRSMIMTHNSEIASRRFPAWLFGRNPNEHIIACSASTTFAQSLSRDVQRVIDTPSYREIFPDVSLNRTNVRNDALGTYIRTAEKFEIVGYSGTYKSAGVGSSISGNPASTLILDDPFGSFADAQSSVMRGKIWDWFLADFLARRSSIDARVMVIQTRWHEDDIIGKLLQLEPELWTLINFPALSESTECEEDPRDVGEALWPLRFPVEELERIKSNAGSYKFAAIYQQRPAPAGGGIFKRNTFKYFDMADNIIVADGHHYELSDCKLYACLDLAIKEKETADYTVAVVFAVTRDGKIFIVEVIRERFEALKHLDFVKMIISKWKCSIVGIESTQYQTALIQQCIKAGLNVKELKPDRDKLTRSLPMQAKLESGIVFFLNSAYWLGDFENELLLFPNGKYDDQVDAFSYIAQMLAPIADYKWPFARNENKPQNGNGNIFSIKNKLERPFNG